MGHFSNEFGSKLLVGLAVFVVMASPIFGYFYNRLMNRLDGDHEHTSMYVAGGVLFTLGMAALISWKASLLMLILFMLDGFPMIVGEFARTEKKIKSPRRRRMPYAANGLLDEAKMSSEEARRLMNKPQITQDDLRLIDHEIATTILKIMEVKQIQQIQR
jgi:hypothetical protein